MGVLRSRIRLRGTDKATLKRDNASERLVEAIEGLEEKIKVFTLQMVDRVWGGSRAKHD